MLGAGPSNQEDILGRYRGVQLQNANGVILQLSGPKVGAEVSAAVGGVTVRLK